MIHNKSSDTGDTGDAEEADAGTMIINSRADNTMIRNSTPMATMTSELGTMVINEEEAGDATAKRECGAATTALPVSDTNADNAASDSTRTDIFHID